MNIWNDQILPRLTERALDTGSVAKFRKRVVSGLTGDVVEIGFGSGLNVPFFPADVSSVMAVEPSTVARSRAQTRIDHTHARIEFVGIDGQELPLASNSADSALSTFTLCTIPDPEVALRELLRVLKPGGELHFLEHGLAESPRVVKWQHRLNPVQRKVAGGCNLDRQILDLIAASGFDIKESETTKMPSAPVLAPLSFLYLGIAAKPNP